MKAVNSNVLKIGGVLCVTALIGYQTLFNSFDKKDAISELKGMKLTEIALKDSMTGKSNKSSKDKILLEEAEVCLSKMGQIPNYRFDEEVTWKVVSFVGQEKVHNISYAELTSGEIALGVEYILTSIKSGEFTNLGGGRGMSSDCLGNIFDKI